MKKAINNPKILKHLAKKIKLYSNPDDNLSEYIYDVFYDMGHEEYQDAIVTLHNMGKTELDKFIRQAVLQATPNSFILTTQNINREAKGILEERERERQRKADEDAEIAEEEAQMAREEAEATKWAVVEEATKKAKQSIRKKLVASLSDKQKKLWKELNAKTNS